MSSCDSVLPYSEYRRQKSFVGLNFCGFDPMKYFREILPWFIGQERLCYIIIKEVLV